MKVKHEYVVNRDGSWVALRETESGKFFIEINTISFGEDGFRFYHDNANTLLLIPSAEAEMLINASI